MSESNLHVLLVEDNPDDADLIGEFLKESVDQTIERHHAIRVSDALTHLETQNTDVILLDLSLPDASGIQGFLTLHEKAPQLPIIILTGLDDNTVAVEAMGKGAQDYLVKSDIEPRLLIRTIRYAIERKRSEQAIQEVERVKVLAQTAITAAHLINQPLTAIIGLVDLMKAKPDTTPETLDKHLTAVRDAGIQIRDIVRKMENIERHVTTTYLGDTDMIDLDAATSKKQ